MGTFECSSVAMSWQVLKGNSMQLLDVGNNPLSTRVEGKRSVTFRLQRAKEFKVDYLAKNPSASRAEIKDAFERNATLAADFARKGVAVQVDGYGVSRIVIRDNGDKVVTYTPIVERLTKMRLEAILARMSPAEIEAVLARATTSLAPAGEQING